jgi:hypothetical protein
MPNLNNIYTAAEAAILWELEESTVRRACWEERLRPGIETRKSPPKDRGIWLVTREGMERLYGKRKDDIK